TRVWWRIGWLSFGGPSAQIALMHRMLVDERRWLAEQEFLDALGFCMLLPGPEAMQLATYAGWKLHGTRGGLIAGLAFVLPGALVVLLLAMVYASYGHLPFLQAAFRGIQAAVLVLVVEAVLRIAKRALVHARQYVLAAAAFVALFAFAVPYPLLVLAAGLVGACWPLAAASGAVRAERIPFSRTLRTVGIWLAIWVLPLVALAAVPGREHVLPQLAWFFSRLAMVTFGGAYAVLAYMSQEVVQQQGWLTARQMLDGLGLAETTPGPLILVTEFVGYVAAFRAAPAGAITQGLAGAAVALWSTFAPCFLWVFAGAPWIGWLGAQPRLKGALAGITAAVLGVIVQLAVWFALHVLFARVGTWRAGPLAVPLPDTRTLDPAVLALTLVSGVLLLRLHWSVHRVLGALVLLSVVLARLGR
ncbi:MAG: chromate efflux transporter, partial [Candidatus Eisenbacteria bacterium]